jgi:hypothetical protein
MLMVKILSFFDVFAMTFELNEYSVEFGKGFVGAGGAPARPYKSFSYIVRPRT